MARIVCLAALLAALLAPAAQAGGPAATARALDRQMSKAGIASGAYVVDLDSGRVIVASAIDNLGKGAAGQAVQCANLMLGLPETAGLHVHGVR